MRQYLSATATSRHCQRSCRRRRGASGGFLLCIVALIAAWISQLRNGTHVKTWVENKAYGWQALAEKNSSARLPQRELTSSSVFTLSYVHVPKAQSQSFERAARWLLPRCRAREAVNGQLFQHLHPRLSQPVSTYTYKRASVGFEDQNVGRGKVIADSSVNEFLWFEEWGNWSGIEAHGATGHGKLFHGKIDKLIEEEWTFYQAPVGAAPVRLPAPSYLNDAHRRGNLHVAHLRTATPDDRAVLLDHSDKSLKSIRDEGAFALLLENKIRGGEFVLLVEGRRGLAHQIKKWLKAAPVTEASDLTSFGSPLWPEDMDVQVPVAGRRPWIGKTYLWAADIISFPRL